MIQSVRQAWTAPNLNSRYLQAIAAVNGHQVTAVAACAAARLSLHNLSPHTEAESKLLTGSYPAHPAPQPAQQGPTTTVPTSPAG
jgi:hypothetical protein